MLKKKNNKSTMSVSCDAYLRLLKNEIVGVAGFACFLYQLAFFFMGEIFLLVYQSFDHILEYGSSE